jgi:3-oxoacyl-[acyl-carrier-protein] synthase-3
MQQERIGLRGWGTYLPQQRLRSAEIAARSGLPQSVVEEKLGIRELAVAGPDDHPAQMGVRAAEKALEQAQLSARDVDVIIYIGEEHKEYPLWTAGIYLQKALQATNAWAFDVALRCGTTVMAMGVAKALLQSRPDWRTVLLAGGYRNGDFIDFQNARTRFMYNLAAGGGAVILQKGYEQNVLLETEVITDGRFSLDVLVPVGGTKAPLTADNLDQYRLDVLDPQGMKQRLEETSMANFLGVVRKALAHSGYTQQDLNYLALLHMKRSAHQTVLGELGLTEENSVYLEEIGHVGQFDQLFSLELGLDQGKIREGDVISMVSAGIGYAWTANTIRWGRWS